MRISNAVIKLMILCGIVIGSVGCSRPYYVDFDVDQRPEVRPERIELKITAGDDDAEKQLFKVKQYISEDFQTMGYQVHDDLEEDQAGRAIRMELTYKLDEHYRAIWSSPITNSSMKSWGVTLKVKCTDIATGKRFLEMNYRVRSDIIMAPGDLQGRVELFDYVLSRAMRLLTETVNASVSNTKPIRGVYHHADQTLGGATLSISIDESDNSYIGAIEYSDLYKMAIDYHIYGQVDQYQIHSRIVEDGVDSGRYEHVKRVGGIAGIHHHETAGPAAVNESGFRHKEHRKWYPAQFIYGGRLLIEIPDDGNASPGRKSPTIWIGGELLPQRDISSESLSQR